MRDGIRLPPMALEYTGSSVTGSYTQFVDPLPPRAGSPEELTKRYRGT